MNYQKFYFKIYLVAFLFLGVSSINAQNKQRLKNEDIFRSPFRYVIVYNQVDLLKDMPASETRRFVVILLDKTAFSKKNLNVLFDLLTKRFSDPYLLYINVFTSLEDTETPEEQDQVRMSGSPSRNLIGNSVSFIRANNRRFFNIQYTNGRSEAVEMQNKP